MPVGGAVFAPVNKYIYIYCARLNGRAFLCPGRAYKKRRKPAFYIALPAIAAAGRCCAGCGALCGFGAVSVRGCVVALSWGVSVRFFGYPVFWAFYWVVFRLFTLCEKVNI